MEPGSIIWGWTFAFGGVVDGEPVTTGFSFNLRDSCNDVAIQSEVLSMNVSKGYNPTYGVGVNPGQGKQNPFSKPLVIGPPGLLNVVICSLNTTPTTNTQLILWGGEPYKGPKC
jgi:hypothetical protein